MIYFNADIRKAEAKTDDAITTSSVGIPVKLALAPEFDGLAKTACFKAGTAKVDIALGGDAAEIVCPPDVLTKAGEWLMMGIYAADGQGDIVIPTVWARVATIVQGTLPSGVDPAAPTPSWVAQVQQAAQDALETAQSVEARADAGDFDGQDGAPGRDGTDGQDGYSPTVTVEEITGGHEVTITDVQGDHTFYVMDGTGSGTTNYNNLSNKPSIEGVTLSGNKTAEDLGLAKATDIPSVPVQSVNNKTGAVVLTAADVGAKPSSYEAPVASVNSKTGAVVLTAADVGAGTYSKPSGGIPKTDLTDAVQASLGKADSALQSVPSTYRTSADQDVIDAGKQEKITASGILKGNGSGGVSAAVAGTDYISPAEYNPDSKTTGMTQSVGVDSSGKLWTVPGGGGGGTTDYTDLSNKPSIEGVTLSGNKTASDLGLAKASDIPSVPVQSVNSKTGAVVLTASDVGALPDNTSIPSKTSDLTNDSGFITLNDVPAAPVSSVNSKTGAVVLSASDVGAYALPSGGIPKSDLASGVQSSLGAADTAYQKPVGGIPAADLASGVIPTVPSAYTSTPEMDGTASAGSSTSWAKGDHVHPTDTSREAKTEYVTLSGSTITQTGADHTMYLCGELATLSFTAPATGITAIRFASGTTPTVVTLTGITMPDNWPSTLDASTTYEINVLNGLGVWASWT